DDAHDHERHELVGTVEHREPGGPPVELVVRDEARGGEPRPQDHGGEHRVPEEAATVELVRDERRAREHPRRHEAHEQRYHERPHERAARVRVDARLLHPVGAEHFRGVPDRADDHARQGGEQHGDVVDLRNGHLVSFDDGMRQMLLVRRRRGYAPPPSVVPWAVQACCSAWVPSAISSTTFAQNAGRSSGLRLETSPASTTTSSSTQSAPAFSRSVRRLGQLVSWRPSTTSASMRIHEPWQITPTGLCCSKKPRTNSTASRSVRSSSPFTTPPGSTSASNCSGTASATCRSTRCVWPFSPVSSPAFGETSTACAPCSVTAFQGSVNSASSKPSVMRKAT